MYRHLSQPKGPLITDLMKVFCFFSFFTPLPLPVYNEIKERQQFLEDMRQLGKGKEMEPIIQGQISQLMSELESVHNADIHRVLAEEQT